MAKRNDAFSTVVSSNPKQNTFDLSYDNKLSFRFGELVPVCVTEVIPGDYFSISCESLERAISLISPVMDRIIVTTHYFFVRNKILWPEFDDFIRSETTPAHPFLDVNINWANEGNIGDYLGYGDPASGTLRQNALPLAAYHKIYDDWYRSDHLQTEEFAELIAGDNGTVWGPKMNRRPLKRNYKHDYFTSALPTPQLGSAVDVPLGTVELDSTTTGTSQLLRLASNHNLALATYQLETDSVTGALDEASGGIDLVLDPNGTLKVGDTTISTLRRAFRLQEWLEMQMRGGTRMVEHQLMMWGERIPDYRADRSIYLGGSKSVMKISEVMSTAESGTAEVGDYAGHAISVQNSGKFSHKCTEHGWIIGVKSVMPDTSYIEQVPKHMFKTDYLDYPWVKLAHIGEEEIYNKEVKAGHTNPDGTFGYTPRYSSYRFKNNEIHGSFKSTLNHFHLGRTFAGDPALNSSFIECDAADHTRIFHVTTGDHILSHHFNNIIVKRKLPKYGVPTI